MFCPKCGNQNPDGAAFCGSCGSALTQQEIPAKPVEPPTRPAETPPPVNDPTAYAAPPEKAPSRAYEPAEYASTAGREAPPRSDAPKPEKPKKSPLVPILIACVAVLAAAVVVLAVFLLKDRKNVTVVTPEPADPSTEVKPTETLLPTEERPTIEIPTVRPEPTEMQLPPQLDSSQYRLAATTDHRVYYYEPNMIGDEEAWGNSVYSCNYDGSDVIHIADYVDLALEENYLVLLTHRSDVSPMEMTVIDADDQVLISNLYVWDAKEIDGELFYLALPDYDPETLTMTTIEVRRLSGDTDELHGTIPCFGLEYPAWIDGDYACVFNPNTGESDQYYLFGQNAPNP